MTEHEIAMKAFMDVAKERFSPKGERTLRFPLALEPEVMLPDVKVTNQVAAPDFAPLIEAFSAALAQNTAALARLSEPTPVTVEAPVVELKHNYEVKAAPVSVSMDVDALVKAVEKQTQICKEMWEQCIVCLKEIARCVAKPREIEIKHNKDGKIIGAKRT